MPHTRCRLCGVVLTRAHHCGRHCRIPDHGQPAESLDRDDICEWCAERYALCASCWETYPRLCRDCYQKYRTLRPNPLTRTGRRKVASR